VTLAQLLARAQEALRLRMAERQTAQESLLALRSDNSLTVEDVQAATATRDAADAAVDKARAEVEDIEAEIAREAELAELATRTPEPTGARGPVARITSEPEVYRQGGETSYFRDLVRAQVRGDRSAFERLERNDRQVADQTRALTTVDGAGGEMVPPMWMVQDYVKLARAGRVFADNLNKQTLPTGTDSISIPKIATGTAVAEQTTQNTAVQNTDATTSSVTSAVATIAGQQVLSVQLIEQSPINMDAILLADLAADYATKLDVFALNNNAAGKLGVLNVSSINAVTYTDASPTMAELYPKIADGIQRVHTNRFLPPEKVFMHPRRWAWALSQVDTAGRPLVVPAALAMNAGGIQNGVESEGLVGSIQGLPVYVDPSIPITLGGGTEDIIIIARTSDVILWEGTPKAEAFRETNAANLSVLLRFYNYAAIQGGRYPKSISTIGGTGLAAPTF
jgi:HK97 family phage major capsid protein